MIEYSGIGHVGSKKAVWNHDFLNKKPWHPLNRQNQARIFEAEQEYLDRKKRDDAAKAEFEAEQQYLETLAHLPGRQADKYRQMQGPARLSCDIYQANAPVRYGKLHE